MEILYRGPLVKRLATPLEELKMIFDRWNIEIDELNENLAESAKEFHTDHIKFASDIDEVKKLIEEGNVVAVNWCGDTDCGEKIEEITGYSVLGIYEELEEAGKKCILSDEDAKYVALIAKTY